MSYAASDRLKEALSDRYTIERELGSRGISAVYLTQDPKQQAKLAINGGRHDEGR